MPPNDASAGVPVSGAGRVLPVLWAEEHQRIERFNGRRGIVITRLDIEQAQRRTRAFVRRTPTFHASETLSFKLEFLQHTGTFKARGAFNRQLSARENGELDSTIGIVVASGGNAGIANAYAASVLGVPATVFVPETAPAVKVALLRTLGATVVQTGREYVEAYEAATEFAAESGALFCHAYDQLEIAAGAIALSKYLPSYVG